eukprot:TRINITY_DN12738_c0_g1_i2.p1 TRINITY_DN12738_c0_g1~~TRINITY_DN12738_c0_g1_i2.p1  ORF type:complete len:225 (-),score=56.23 TRINITY_DN12738_c0_g1_i2:18-692(-)
MHSYFAASVSLAPSVKVDASERNISEQDLEPCFQEYMTAPFAELRRQGWELAYQEADVGPTSAFGHLVDHMAVSDARKPVRVERLLTTNQGFGSKANRDTDIPITDHNAVTATFDFADILLEEPSWYTGGCKGDAESKGAETEDRDASVQAALEEWARQQLEPKLGDLGFAMAFGPGTPRSDGACPGTPRSLGSLGSSPEAVIGCLESALLESFPLASSEGSPS